MLLDCSREYLLKKNSWGSMPPNPPSNLTVVPLDSPFLVPKLNPMPGRASSTTSCQ